MIGAAPPLGHPTKSRLPRAAALFDFQQDENPVTKGKRVEAKPPYWFCWIEKSLVLRVSLLVSLTVSMSFSLWRG